MCADLVSPKIDNWSEIINVPCTFLFQNLTVLANVEVLSFPVLLDNYINELYKTRVADQCNTEPNEEQLKYPARLSGAVRNNGGFP
jgi:hypothetical protein